jgi:hypothetical protein
MSMKRPLPANVALVLTLGNGIVNSSFSVYLALYAKSIGLTTAQWAGLSSVGVFINCVALFGLPRVQARLGTRTTMQVSCLLLAAAFGGIATGRLAVVAGAMLLCTFLTTANNICIAIELQSDPERLGKRNSAYTIVNGVSTIVAPILAATIVSRAGYTAFWCSCIAFLVVQVGLCMLLPRHAAGESAPMGRASGLGPRFIVGSGLGWLLLGTALLEPFGFQMLGLYSALRLSSLGLSDAAIGYVTAIGSVVYLCSSILAYFLLDRLPIRIAYAAALTGGALGVTLFGLSGAVLPAVAGLCVYQLCYAWVHPGKNVRHALFATPKAFPSIYSLSISVLSFSSASVSAVSAALVGIVGMAPLMVVGGLVAAVGGATTLAAPTRSRIPLAGAARESAGA